MQRIMVNTCLDYLRSSSLKSEMVMHVNSIPAEESNISVSNEAMEHMEFKELVKLIQGLPAMTRTVFNLYVFDGYNHKEISDQLDISEGTSHWHVHQARNMLQKKITTSEQQKVTYEAKRI
jgi:RNA polymerase sigma-70 factor (ECF subfamily)